MQATAPNFVSVRLTDEDKAAYVKAHAAAERAIGMRLTTADVYRLAMQALTEKHKIKGA